jgi:hypothetical protein
MNRSRWILGFSFSVALVAACGGSKSNSTAPTDAGANDASTTDGGFVPASCPIALPTAGAPCQQILTECEYGGDGPLRLCSTVARCDVASGTTAGTWDVALPASTCVGTQAQNSAGCPASFGALASGSACPASEGISAGTCVYPEGLCACETCTEIEDGGALGPSKPEWACDPYPAPVGNCPATKPALGSACSVEGQECQYGNGCGSPLVFSAVGCQDGSWSQLAVGLDCAVLTFSE